VPINLRAPEVTELKPRLTVLGVGGAGGNAVNNMINAKLEGVTFVVANTDAQALAQSRCQQRIQLGTRLTEGLGAGAKPEVGRGAAEESIDEILEHLSGAHMVFITAGMGGGTGTGAAPVIARAVRELGVLTVGVVTKPFHFEGDRRMKQAERGIEELQTYVDTLIVIPNQNLFRVATERTTFAQAFAMADEVLHSGVRGITDLIVMPGLINRDFADIKTVMSEMGKAMMGTGECDGENRALRAAEAAISNPLLDEVSMKGARSVLVNVTGGVDLMLFEVDEAVNRIRAEVDPDANILFGSALSETMEGRVRVSVVATGIEAEAYARNAPDNVHSLRHHRRISADEPLGPTAREVRSPRAEAVTSPVHRQVESIVNGLNARAEAAPVAAVHQAMEPQTQPAAMAEPAAIERVAAEVRAAAQAEAQALSEFHPKREKRGGFGGLFGGRKRDARAAAPAPAQAQRSAAPQAQPAISVPPAEAVRATAEPRTQPSDDLFSGVTEEDRFEIPAFLRRQVNSGN
jgi:cell division protein FtsZ